MQDRIEQQLSLFDEIYPKFEIKQPIILIELFAGIGAQRKALENLGVAIDNEKSKICEWAAPSIRAYNAIHIKDNKDYSKNLSKQELIDYLKDNISTDYNQPCNVEKKPENWLRDIYNNCIATHNLMNIMKVKGADLGELPKNQTSILCYSFPCQDLSLAGQGKGMSTSQAQGGTRSGLLWEVERILIERERDNSTLPHILLMENVPEVVGSNNINDFKKWEERLRNFGYTNYVEIINGKDYGIPQNRRRTFMISILGEYAFTFPRKLKLQYVLKDFLEKEVDEKYYLSDKMLEYITASNEKWTGNNDKAIVNKDIGCTINTAPTQRRCDASNYVSKDLPQNADLKRIGGLYDKGKETHQAGSIYDNKGLSPTLDCSSGGGNRQPFIAIKENNSQGFKNAQVGDGVNLASRMKHQRGNVQRERVSKHSKPKWK